MTTILYGLGRARITLYSASGVPTYRITLQIVQDSKGLSLTFPPEAIRHDLGSGAGFARAYTFRGFRPVLLTAWTYGLTSLIETWTPGTPGAWGAATEESTALSLSRIHAASWLYPCLVEPHKDKAFSFAAQPDPEVALRLQDDHQVAHSDLDLCLVASRPMAMPAWATL